MHYIYQNENWTAFTWKESTLMALLAEVHRLRGKLTGQMGVLGFRMKEQTQLSTLTEDELRSSEIEGERLNTDQVRSSIARRLGMEHAGLVPSDRHVDGVVDMTLDAVQHYRIPLTDDRLFAWHAALFPTGRSGLYSITVGQYRNREMQIVSGGMGYERVHYQAPPPSVVKAEMDLFLRWINEENSPLDPILKAAIAHFRFIIIHPFDDGNGRMARALTDMLLARADGSPERYYSMSSRIMVERKQYYAVLQRVQHSEGDITSWLVWFLECLKNALIEADQQLQGALRKADFWSQHEHTPLNERQRLLLNRLLDGFEGYLKTSKWARIAKCSTDTALRDIKDLMDKGILQQQDSGGRSTHYTLV
jgi:Fic family protein